MKSPSCPYCGHKLIPTGFGVRCGPCNLETKHDSLDPAITCAAVKRRYLTAWNCFWLGVCGFISAAVLSFVIFVAVVSQMAEESMRFQPPAHDSGIESEDL